MGIHYDYKSTKSVKQWKSKPRERESLGKKAKRLAKGFKKENKSSQLDASKPITLDFLTNPNKEWTLKKNQRLSLALKEIY